MGEGECIHFDNNQRDAAVIVDRPFDSSGHVTYGGIHENSPKFSEVWLVNHVCGRVFFSDSVIVYHKKQAF